MAGYLRFVLFLALAMVACVASGFAGDPLTILIETTCPPANCAADPGFMGGPAGGEADFNSIGYPWTYNFQTANALTWSQNGNTYSATFGYGGSFAMTGPGGLTFTGVVTSGSADVGGFHYDVVVQYSGQWSNGLYGYGVVSSFFDPTSGKLIEGFDATQVTYSKVHDFTGGQDGAGPYAGLTIDNAGNLYGTTYTGGAGYGTVYKLAPKGSGWAFNPLYIFSGSADGAYPYGRVILGPNATLYGTTFGGGNEAAGCGGGCGTVFNLRPAPTACTTPPCSWTEKVLHPFAGTDGSRPIGDLVFDKAGNIFGATYLGGGMGGDDGAGVVYELTTSGVGSVLYDFPETGCTKGANPLSGVIFDTAGNLYGTTTTTGLSCGYGVVFQLTPSGSGWIENVLYTFQDGSDGGLPYAGLTMDQLGNLYGSTTTAGGPGGGGTVFEMMPTGGSWELTTISSFNGGDSGGPQANLVMNGVNLYGTTVGGGAYGYGSVFEVGVGDIYDFTGGADGAYPYSNLVFDANGNLYGTTSQGGTNGQGVVFEITVSR